MQQSVSNRALQHSKHAPTRQRSRTREAWQEERKPAQHCQAAGAGRGDPTGAPVGSVELEHSKDWAEAGEGSKGVNLR